MESITWKIGGEAGFGIISSGIMLARTFARKGYFVFTTNEYPSLIRGGHNVVTVRIATEKFHAMNHDLHVLVALNAETVELHTDDLRDGTYILFDPDDRNWNTSDFSQKVRLLPLPLKETVKKFSGDTVMRNTVALGASIALLGKPLEMLSAVIHDQFKKKSEDIINQNIMIAKSGYDHMKTTFPDAVLAISEGKISGKQAIINGSEALGVGAVRAGLKFAAIYPMTPINSLITFLADHAKSLQLVYKQPEDEIAGINMAIGASVGGVRSMVATSGGGYALMVEGVSLAGMIEAPVVVDMGMRVGPATGMPTYTEQGDLLFVIQSGHGEFPKIVLAPGDAKETFDLTVDAFNLADRYQLPVFILTDKYLNESQWCVDKESFTQPVLIDRGKLSLDGLPEDGSFKRYDMGVQDGVSPRSVPGVKNGQFYANSYEHDQTGHVMDQAQGRARMVEKRLKKLQASEKDMKGPAVYGDASAPIRLVTWGSTKGPVLEALEQSHFTVQGVAVNCVHFTWMYPFPIAETKKALLGAKRIIDIEQNATGQLASLICQQTGIEITEKILKYDGRVFWPEEIIEKL